MRRDDALQLDILLAAQKIQRFVGDMTAKQFADNEMAQSAVIRELQVIGDASRLMTAETQAAHPEIEWADIIGMRNRLIHGYFAIRLDIVWKVAKEDLPRLITAIEPLIPPDDEEDE